MTRGFPYQPQDLGNWHEAAFFDCPEALLDVTYMEEPSVDQLDGLKQPFFVGSLSAPPPGAGVTTQVSFSLQLVIAT